MTDTRTEGVEALGGTADVIVVGAGVIGCATAYNLALRGRSVVVLDSDGSVAYTELVPEIGQEPDYDAALQALA